MKDIKSTNWAKDVEKKKHEKPILGEKKNSAKYKLLQISHFKDLIFAQTHMLHNERNKQSTESVPEMGFMYNLENICKHLVKCCMK